MSKECLCRYLCEGISDTASCGWRLASGGTKIPSQAEIKGDDYDPDLDWCIPAQKTEGFLTDPIRKAVVMDKQGECDVYESSEGRFPLYVSFLPRE